MRVDLLCADYVAAARNRRMVRLKQNITGYLWIEAIVRNCPRSKPLPEWLYHELPQIGKREAKELHKYGIYEVE